MPTGICCPLRYFARLLPGVARWCPMPGGTWCLVTIRETWCHCPLVSGDAHCCILPTDTLRCLLPSCTHCPLVPSGALLLGVLATHWCPMLSSGDNKRYPVLLSGAQKGCPVPGGAHCPLHCAAQWCLMPIDAKNQVKMPAAYWFPVVPTACWCMVVPTACLVMPTSHCCTAA